jgi:hypothetical protein
MRGDWQRSTDTGVAAASSLLLLLLLCCCCFFSAAAALHVHSKVQGSKASVTRRQPVLGDRNVIRSFVPAYQWSFSSLLLSFILIDSLSLLI